MNWNFKDYIGNKKFGVCKIRKCVILKSMRKEENFAEYILIFRHAIKNTIIQRLQNFQYPEGKKNQKIQKFYRISYIEFTRYFLGIKNQPMKVEYLRTSVQNP